RTPSRSPRGGAMSPPKPSDPGSRPRTPGGRRPSRARRAGSGRPRPSSRTGPYPPAVGDAASTHDNDIVTVDPAEADHAHTQGKRRGPDGHAFHPDQTNPVIAPTTVTGPARTRLPVNWA